MLRMPFLCAHALDFCCARASQNYMMLKFEAREEHREVLEEFPPVFRARLFRHLYRPVIHRGYLLKGVSEAFIDMLACNLEVELFMPNVTIVSQARSDPAVLLPLFLSRWSSPAVLQPPLEATTLPALQLRGLREP